MNTGRERAFTADTTADARDVATLRGAVGWTAREAPWQAP